MDEERTTRAEILFVPGLFLLAALIWTGTILHGRGVWFDQSTARILYRLLWTLLWLPGIAMSAALFYHVKRLPLAIGGALQLGALFAY